MSTYTKQMQSIVMQYRLAGQPWPAQSKAIAAWAIAHNLWHMHPSLALAKCTEDLSRAMREEFVTDRQGRRVRVKHPVTVRRRGKQMVLWDDMRTAPRDHMKLAFQQRRQQIVGDCKQLKADVDSYNDLNSYAQPLQIIFDFTMDLAEIEAAA